MNSQKSEYETALQTLFRATKRFRGQIQKFRDADIGSEIWDAIHGGSMIPGALSCAEIGNDMLLEELWKLGPVCREQLHRQERNLFSKLVVDGWKLATERILVTGIKESRVESILVAYRPTSALDRTTVRTKAEVAIMAAMSDDQHDTLYASDLKRCLEDEGLYGIALQDMREETFDWLLAMVIAMGRLDKHLNART